MSRSERSGATFAMRSGYFELSDQGIKVSYTAEGPGDAARTRRTGPNGSPSLVLREGHYAKPGTEIPRAKGELGKATSVILS